MPATYDILAYHPRLTAREAMVIAHALLDGSHDKAVAAARALPTFGQRRSALAAELLRCAGYGDGYKRVSHAAGEADAPAVTWQAGEEIGRVEAAEAMLRHLGEYTRLTGQQLDELTAAATELGYRSQAVERLSQAIETAWEKGGGGLSAARQALLREVDADASQRCWDCVASGAEALAILDLMREED